VADEPQQWWVRSFRDRDTHRGTWLPRGGSVRAVCGIEFIPLPVGLPAKRAPLPGRPPDPDQICPTCYRAGVRA
jgi:hypothetical protein